MNAVIELREALRGWWEMLAANKGGANRFNVSRDGLITALIWFGAAVAITLFVQNAMRELPTYGAMFVSVAANTLPMAGLLLAIYGSALVLDAEGGFLGLAVPAVYATSIVFIIDLPISLAFGDLFANLKYGILGYMLFRVARDCGKLGIGVSIAFAVLGIVALAALYAALYMLTVPAPPAA